MVGQVFPQVSAKLFSKLDVRRIMTKYSTGNLHRKLQ